MLNFDFERVRIRCDRAHQGLVLIRLALNELEDTLAPIEAIEVQGKKIITVIESLQPGLRAVFVGINRMPIPVDCGIEYYDIFR